MIFLISVYSILGICAVVCGSNTMDAAVFREMGIKIVDPNAKGMISLRFE